MTPTPEISDDLTKSAYLYWQDDGRRWCEDLPGQIVHYLDRWRCEIEAPIRGASTAYVARVRREDASPALLKISYPAMHRELDALRAYGGERTVEVYEGERSALLLEWCDPGSTLRDGARTDEALEVTLALMDELWQTKPFAGVDTLARQCGHYFELGQRTLADRPELVCREYQLGLEILGAFGRVKERGVLLHGDLHPGNILKSARRPWIAIDPRPLRGDPAYETIPLILEVDPDRIDRPDEREILMRIDAVASRLRLSPRRVALWGAARSCDWALFCHRASQHARAERARAQLHCFLAALETIDGAPPYGLDHLPGS